MQEPRFYGAQNKTLMTSASVRVRAAALPPCDGAAASQRRLYGSVTADGQQARAQQTLLSAERSKPTRGDKRAQSTLGDEANTTL